MFILRFIKNLVFWEYRRGSWQHEFLCLAFIAALIVIPTNSNGWFADGEQVRLSDDSVVTLHRHNTTLYLTLEGGSESDPKSLREFIDGRFGAATELIRDRVDNLERFRIIPRGLE